jgi:hypothetical protein
VPGIATLRLELGLSEVNFEVPDACAEKEMPGDDSQYDFVPQIDCFGVGPAAKLVAKLII